MAKEKIQIDWLKYENELREQGFNYICGVDEAGRGPLAGPVCAAAVILPPDTIIEGVNDSKKLSEKKREELFDVVIDTALSYCIAFGSVEEIEEHNILATTMNTMKRAVEGLDIKADFAIIDGNKLPPLSIPSKYIVKGDANSMSIAAASILAKVSRDRLMLEYAKAYPQYCFEKHKGYGTKLHTQMILKYGPSKIHRMSFLKKLLNKQENE
ncbi:MAG: ribonuclease HII [Ruminococcus sp.]|nr:ribonuclease HII [Ruminococcus sp.]